MSKSNKILPLISLIGKPNVGKSSLFNRLIKRSLAITSEIPGTTRDRLYKKIKLPNLEAILIDTPGISFNENSEIENNMKIQTEQALAEADLILFIVDGQHPPLLKDFDIAKKLRQQNKKLILITNKCDNLNMQQNIYEWFTLGFNTHIAISVKHNLNIQEMINLIEQKIKELGFKPIPEITEIKDKKIHIAFVGRPNAGKSSLINAIIGEKRNSVSDVPGTTRDTIDTEYIKDDKTFVLLDTAGIRRRGKITKGIEKFSIFRTLRAIENADIVCLVLDYSIGVRAQDLHICSYILEANKGLIFLMNKYDLMENKEKEMTRVLNILKNRFDFLSWSPIIFTSAKNHKNLDKIFENAAQIYLERQKEIEHQVLVSFLQEAIHQHQAPSAGRKKLYFYDIIQTGNNPPTFRLTVNNNDVIHFSYQRYLENKFREKFGFLGTAILFEYQNLEPKLIRKTEFL